jgi:hypothetical protein
MDADTTLQILRDIIAGNDHKHSASDRSEALKIFLADVADATRNSANTNGGRFVPINLSASSPSTEN